MDEDQESCRIDCKFGFRVECHHGELDCYNQMLSDGDMIPRSPSPAQQPWLGMVDNHLSWNRAPTPFISFFTSYKRAMKWRDGRIKQQARDFKRPAENVVVIAVWLGGMQNVYSAYKAATLLNYTKDSNDNRRKPGYFVDEVLVQGSILESEHRILALFHGNLRGTQSVELKPEPNGTETVTVEVPYQSLVAPGELAEGANERLRSEVFERMGDVHDHSGYCMLVLALCGREFSLLESGGRIVVEDNSSVERKCYKFVVV